MRVRRAPHSAIALFLSASAFASAPEPAAVGQSTLDSLSIRAVTLHSQRRYGESAALFREGAVQALAGGDHRRAVRFWNAAAGSHSAAFQFRDALREFLAARDLARKTGDGEMLGVVALNVASLLSYLHDHDSAAASLREGVSALPPGSKNRAGLLAIQGQVLLRSRNPTLASRVLLEALDLTDAGPDWRLRAEILDALGMAARDLKRPHAAEQYLLEAHRIKVLMKTGSRGESLRLLAQLRRQNGDLHGAFRLIRLAIDLDRRTPASALNWHTELELAVLLQAAGRDDEALAHLRAVTAKTLRLRSVAVPSLSAMTGVDIENSAPAARHAWLAAQLGHQRNVPALVDEALLAVERNRAAALMAFIVTRTGFARLGNDYLNILDHLRRLEMTLAVAPGVSRQAELQHLRSELALREARLLPAFSSTDSPWGLPLPNLRAAIPTGAVAFSFLPAPGHSWLWAVTRTRTQLVRLPGENELRGSVRSFRDCLQAGGDCRSASEALGRTLFGLVQRDLLAQPTWILSLDGPLFELPFAALRLPDENTYLIESRRIRTVPSLLAVGRQSAARIRGDATVLGDPIYSYADPRWPKPGRQPDRLSFNLWPLLALPHSSNSGQLPRLLGSAREVDLVARRWTAAGHRVTILTGAGATVANLARTLGSSPSLVHLATHVQKLEPGRAAEGESWIVTSMDPAGRPDGLTETSILGLPAHGSLVVMSGCASASGRAVSGAGLVGLARSWLLSGASGVVGSLWPVPDEVYPLFDRFYFHLSRGLPPDEALRSSQIDQIREGGSAALPSRWAAWYFTGKS